MLEVSATLDREAAIYLAGETVRITVTVRNTSRGKQGSVEQLAWGSLQLICGRYTLLLEVMFPFSRKNNGSVLFVVQHLLFFPSPANDFNDEIGGDCVLVPTEYPVLRIATGTRTNQTVLL